MDQLMYTGGYPQGNCCPEFPVTGVADMTPETKQQFWAQKWCHAVEGSLTKGEAPLKVALLDGALLCMVDVETVDINCQ